MGSLGERETKNERHWKVFSTLERFVSGKQRILGRKVLTNEDAVKGKLK